MADFLDFVNVPIYDKYKAEGGQLDYNTWLRVGKPSTDITATPGAGFVDQYGNVYPGKPPANWTAASDTQTAGLPVYIAPASYSPPVKGSYNTNPGGGSETAYSPLTVGESASQNLADVTRATYEDWRKQYLPIALEMMNQTTYNNPDLVGKEVKSAVGNVESAFKNAQGLQDRTASRYGISFDDRQRAASDRITGLEKSTAVVDAANRIRQKLADRNKQIAAGGIPAINATQGG